MKGILIALVIFALTSLTSLLLASCDPASIRYMESDGCGAAYGYDQQGEYLKISQTGHVDLYEWEGHLWRPVELRHADECNCGGDYSWDEDEIFEPEDGNEGNSYSPYREFRENYKKANPSL